MGSHDGILREPARPSEEPRRLFRGAGPCELPQRCWGASRALARLPGGASRVTATVLGSVASSRKAARGGRGSRQRSSWRLARFGKSYRAALRVLTRLPRGPAGSYKAHPAALGSRPEARPRIPTQRSLLLYRLPALHAQLSKQPGFQAHANASIGATRWLAMLQLLFEGKREGTLENPAISRFTLGSASSTPSTRRRTLRILSECQGSKRSASPIRYPVPLSGLP